MTKWQLREAKAPFSELIDDTLENGPQVVTVGESLRRLPFQSTNDRDSTRAGGRQVRLVVPPGRFAALDFK